MISRGQSINKGAPSGLLISLLVHAAAFMLAGLLVVYTVHQREEVQFEPPTLVKRPKMKLKKPKVNIKKSVKPKPSSRIMSKMKSAKMPEIQLPNMSGMGEGFEGGAGWGVMPEVMMAPSPFGGAFTTGSDLRGYFYNFNRGRSGRPIPMSPDQLENLIHVYMKNGWRTSRFKNYYRSPTTLYASTVCIPTVMSELAPESFGEDAEEGYCWAVLYEGDLVYPEDITFRFWGVGDKFMGVAVDDETILFCAYRSRTRETFGDIWHTKDAKDMTYYFGESRARPSDWITLKAGEVRHLKILLGDLDGGLVYHMLSVEVKGETYPLDRAGGGPTFPVFRTDEIAAAVRDRIYSDLYPGDVCLTNGPIFRDYLSPAVSVAAEPAEEVTPPVLKDTAPVMRVWTALNGKTLEARFRTVMGPRVILENQNKKQITFPLASLTPADRTYIQLMSPPKFDIVWSKKSAQIANPPLSPWGGGSQRPLQMFNYDFGVRIRTKTKADDYPYEVKVEYFAIGEEVDGDHFVLLERNEGVFNPQTVGKKGFELRGKAVTLRRMAYRDTAPVRGTKYGGYLITLTDREGDVIGYKASHEFLFEKLNALRKLAPNNHFNRDGQRVIPARPTEDSRGAGATEGAG